jgi:hypothetical protein
MGLWPLFMVSRQFSVVSCQLSVVRYCGTLPSHERKALAPLGERVARSRRFHQPGRAG